MGTYNGTYTSTVTLSSTQSNTTLGATGLMNAYGPAGTYALDLNHTVTSETFAAALFGPAGTVFTITNDGVIETSGNPKNWFDAGVVLGAPGTVVNNGTIEGNAGIFMIGSAGSTGALVENTGLIVGSISAGIFLGTSGTVLNAGSISGPKSGVIFQNSQPAYLSNASAGVISSSGGYAAQMYGGTVVNQGLLAGLYGGVAFKGTVETVSNAGTILSTATAPGSYGAYAALQISQETLSPGASVTNSSGGHIAGGYGIRINNAGSTTSASTAVDSITNAGVIIGSLASGIADWAGTLVLQNTGAISATIGTAGTAGNDAGVQTAYTGLVHNSLGGSISGDWGVKLGSGTVFNAGSIAGDTASSGTASNYAGIYLQNGGDLFNSLSGHITGASGIRINGGSANYVSNAGFIDASKGAGIYFYQSGTVTNTGTITGPHHGVVTGATDGGAAGLITNSGLIESSDNTFIKNAVTKTGGGIALLGGGEVTNQSTGIITGANGLYGTAASGGITINNLGLIQGTYKNGIVLASAGYISNSGSIEGAKDGIYVKSGIATVQNAGIISGTSGTGIGLKAGGTIVDSGTITGTADAIYFGTSASTLILDPGAGITGSIAADAGLINRLELASASAAGSFDMGGTVSGFSQISFAAGSHWTLEGSQSELATGTMEISGFGIGDTIILDGFTASSETFTPGTLSLSNGITTETIGLLGIFVGETFALTSVPAGTEITLQELCYLRGTRILTPAGERLVEDLRPGDEVVTRRSGIARLKWIGYQAFAGRFLARDPACLPVRILAGALGDGVPLRALTLSPGHSVLLGETLVLARDLVNGITVLQDEVPEVVEYFALELEAHDCVIAEGAFAESFADGPGLRNQFHNAAAFYARYPDYVVPDELALCAPRPQAGPALEAALRPVVARAAALARPGRVRGFIDRVDASGHVEGWAQDLENPELPVPLEIRVDGSVAGTVLACGYRPDLRAAGIGKGRAMFSFDAPPGGHVTVHCAADGMALPLTDDCQMRLAG